MKKNRLWMDTNQLHLLGRGQLSPKSNAKDKKDGASHPIRKEIRGLVLLFVAIILGGSLLSYHPSDQLFWDVTGPLEKANNLFGTIGAHLSGALFFLLGFSSFWLFIVFFALAFLSFRGGPILSPVKSFIAIVALLASSSAILNLQLRE